MKQQACSCYRCNNLLTIFEEVMFGICEAHIALLLDDNNYAGVCWECNRITIVASRRQGLIKDKYIFAKGCKCCTDKEENNINWMTIKADTPSVTSVLITKPEDPIKYLKNHTKVLSN